MVVPLIGRSVGAVAGALLVLTAGSSVIGTLIVPRPTTSWLTGGIDRVVDGGYRFATAAINDYKRRDRVLATEAAAILVTQLAVWLGIFFLGFSLLMWPFVHGGITDAFTTAGPALWEIGSVEVGGSAQRTILDVASLTGIVTVTLQIAYLPTLYSAFNRRETEVALLNARGGAPSWGPELLARTHYALGTGISTIDTLPDLYATWERWAADVGESHTTYLPLVRFRSPRALSSWVTSLLAVLDSAALFLALSPDAAPVVPARLCLRGGFICLHEIARAMGFRVPEETDPNSSITLTYDEFLDAVNRMREVNFPIERDPADAWPDFVGWRLNYEYAAYAVAEAVNAVPALWSGRRRWVTTPIPPLRPPMGRQHPTPSAESPSAGSPSAGSPSAGSPSAGSPSAGSPSAGSPSAGSPSTGSPSTGFPSTGSPNTG